MNNNFYTYAYLRDDGTPYYIGKGKGGRAYKKHKRTNNRDLRPLKDGFIDKDRILILKKNISEEEAFKHEVYMINLFGRKDLGTGILCNMTYGGEGVSGFDWNNERRQDISKRISKPFRLVSPELKLVEGINLYYFCEKNKLIQSSLCEVIKGTRKHHRLWTHPDRPLSTKVFYIKNSEGKLFCFGDIEKFSKENKISKHCLYSVAVRKQYKLSSSGWHVPDYNAKEYKLVSPEGSVVVWNPDDRKFCSKYGLRKHLLRMLVSGEISQTGGWTRF